MRHGITAHPADLRDLAEHGGYARLAELGFDDVALQVSQAGGRRITPWSPHSAVQCLEMGVCHFRPKAEYGALRPTASSLVPDDGPSPLETHIEASKAAGLEAWVSVGPFNDPRLGRAHPDSGLQNAFGDRYPHAICPTRPEVQDYAVRLIDEIVGHEGVAGIELHSIGFLGHQLGGVTSSLPPDPYSDFLLSYCFCDECVARIGKTGLNARSIRQRVRQLATERRQDFDSLAPPAPRAPEDTFRRLEDDLGGAVMFAMWSHRLSVYMRLLSRLQQVVMGRAQIALRLQLNSLGSDESMGAPLKAIKAHVDEVVVSHFSDTPESIRPSWRGQPIREIPTRAAIMPKAPQYQSVRDIRRAVEGVRGSGGHGLWIHELGLLPWPTLEAVGEALRPTPVEAH